MADLPGTNSTILLGASDIHWFNEGTHHRLYEKLGAHYQQGDGTDGTHFAVWAPGATAVSVMGDFNGWQRTSHPLHPQASSGIWAGFLPEVAPGTHYKYAIDSRYRSYRVDKADPFAFYAETPPQTASIVWDLAYHWGDERWLAQRPAYNTLTAPVAIYEVHLGSWRRHRDRPLTYRELAEQLPRYVTEMGFTHVEFMPVMEHPFYASWGYQITGFFSPTARYGTPQDFMALIDALHQQGIGVILDWVPSHFPTDEIGLGYFDGTHLYEHADRRQGFHPDWNTFIFNYGRPEVRSFLISNALFWLDRYHADALRVDAVSSMLYLNYSRKPGEWVPNKNGGNENLEAVDFLQRFNTAAFAAYPGTQTIAEESSAWPNVSRPVETGGLGFGLKWDMGWMNDTLRYMARDPFYRKHYQDELTFRAMYASNENYILPLSHDEVVHGKGSLLRKMPGPMWQKFANLRLLFGYMYGQPGKKLLFMGNEIGQWSEWNHDESLSWHLLDEADHAGMQRWVHHLNHLYCEQPALHQRDCDPDGFMWIDCNDRDHSILLFLRRAQAREDVVVIAGNFTPVPRHNYRVGLPTGGHWIELLNGDDRIYGGSGIANTGGITASAIPWQGQPYSAAITLPPLAMLFLAPQKP